MHRLADMYVWGLSHCENGALRQGWERPLFLGSLRTSQGGEEEGVGESDGSPVSLAERALWRKWGLGRGARSQEVLGGQAEPPLALGMSSWYTSNIEIRASGDKCQCGGLSGFHVGFPWITGRPVSEVLLRRVHRMDSGDPLSPGLTMYTCTA